MLAVGLLLCAVPTTQAVRCPTTASMLASPAIADGQQRLNEEMPSPEQAGRCVFWAVDGEGRIGVFVGNNPINEIDPYGLAFRYTSTGLRDGIPGPYPYVKSEGWGNDRWFDYGLGPLNNAVSTVMNATQQIADFGKWLGGTVDRALIGGTGELGENAGQVAIFMLIPAGRCEKAAETVAPSSRALGRALEAAGFERQAGEAAHHIVAGGAEAAAPARAVLERFEIGINDAANGVFLPGTRATPNAVGAAVHSPLHTPGYYQAVNEALGQATTRQEALEVLQALRQSLLGGGL